MLTLNPSLTCESLHFQAVESIGIIESSINWNDSDQKPDPNGYGCVETRTKCIWRRRNSSQTLIREQKLRRDAQIQKEVSYCRKFQRLILESSTDSNDADQKLEPNGYGGVGTRAK